MRQYVIYWPKWKDMVLYPPWLHSALLNILSRKRRGEVAKDKPPQTTQRWEVVWLVPPFALSLWIKKEQIRSVLKKSPLTVIAFIKKLKITAPSFLNFFNFSGIFPWFKVFSFENLFQNLMGKLLMSSTSYFTLLSICIMYCLWQTA